MFKQLNKGKAFCFLVILAFSGSAWATTHNWADYHWARTSPSFTLKVIDSITADWQYAFDETLAAWSVSTVMDLDIVSVEESNRTRKRCNAKTGQMHVCNADYGFNGWLGLASIYVDSNAHITKGIAKVNDSYASYWDTYPFQKNHVMCQEIGHVLGLGHTSEDGTSQRTCMDYSKDLESQWPNQEDFDMLVSIYGYHEDDHNSYDVGSSTTDGGGCTAPAGKGCNKNQAAEPAPVPMGVLVHRGEHHEIRVAPGEAGGLWIHHIRLVPEAYK